MFQPSPTHSCAIYQTFSLRLQEKGTDKATDRHLSFGHSYYIYCIMQKFRLQLLPMDIRFFSICCHIALTFKRYRRFGQVLNIEFRRILLNQVSRQFRFFILPIITLAQSLPPSVKGIKPRCIWAMFRAPRIFSVSFA